MSGRLTAPAGSPLRRTGIKESVHSKSPIRRLDAKTKLRSNGIMVTTEADSFQLQAEAAAVQHDVAHLSPALQRFWQVNFHSRQIHHKRFTINSHYRNPRKVHYRLDQYGSAKYFQNPKGLMGRLLHIYLMLEASLQTWQSTQERSKRRLAPSSADILKQFLRVR